MVILVTGATGFVMANLVRHLAEHGHEVVAADVNRPDGVLKQFVGGLPGTVTFVKMDVTDRDDVLRLIADIRPARAVHGAAVTAIPADTERTRFLETVDVNVLGTLHVLEALRETGVARAVVVSSGSVYGPRGDLTPISEDEPKRPEGVYALTKWAGEELARRFAAVHGLDVPIVRLASPFGPLERDTGSRPLLSPVHEWVAAALAGEPVRVSGAPTLVRDAVHVADVASAITAVLLADRLSHDVYNVGWGRVISAHDALAALGTLIPTARVELRPDEPSPWAATSRGPLAIDRLRADLGWAPRYDFGSGLAAYVEWRRAQPQA